jgi:peptidoglycan/LPS O-acetylase OafA/YrhL
MTSLNAPAGSSPARLLHIDLLKLLAANSIVLHHLAAYGPIADAMAAAWPALMAWLYDDARMAVQVFLVIGGYLAARGLSRFQAGGSRLASPVRAMRQRYTRLVLPYLAALLLAVVGAALARQWMSDDSIPAAPWPSQVLAHALLLQDLLQHDALSAGVWYVAIDFQLFCVMVLLVWVGGRVARRGGSPRTALRVTQWLVLGLMVSSLFFFNRDVVWDVWAVYFFGAYGLGAAVYWAAGSKQAGRYLGVLAAIGLAALWVDFRGRIAVALAVALLLGLVQARGQFVPLVSGLLERAAGPLAWLHPASYALFLVHFPICLLGNALFTHLDGEGAAAGSLALALTWGTSVALAVLFHRRVELPLAAAVQRRPAVRPSAATASRPRS